jgi:transposase
VQAKRAAYREWAADIDPGRLVFIDESGANLAMGRSHAWVLRGTELVEPRPRNWGDNLTLIGAIRMQQWVTMSTFWHATTRVCFLDWIRRRLAPKLRPGDIVVMDNLAAHKDERVREAIEAVDATVHYLPPYGHDLNPIEPAWGLMKKRIRAVAPRTGLTLRRTAHHASRAVRPDHCRHWFAHAGYRQLK